MKSFDRKILAAVVFPILALLALTGYKAYVLNSGIEIELPISGYDPRDLLAGHYLIYTIDYGVPDICPESRVERDGYVCLTSKTFSAEPPVDCVTFIKGVCHYRRFEAGVEKFYIPEDKAKSLEKDVRERKASVILSVTGNGTAQVKELLIDGKPWHQP